MFEVRCLVADKRLADVLRALRKLTLEPPVTIAVDDILANGHMLESPKEDKLKHGKRGAKSATIDFVADAIKSGAKIITATQLRKHMESVGFAPHSYSYPLSTLIKQRVLKPTKDSGTYEVMK